MFQYTRFTERGKIVNGIVLDRLAENECRCRENTAIRHTENVCKNCEMEQLAGFICWCSCLFACHSYRFPLFYSLTFSISSSYFSVMRLSSFIIILMGYQFLCLAVVLRVSVSVCVCVCIKIPDSFFPPPSRQVPALHNYCIFIRGIFGDDREQSVRGR